MTRDGTCALTAGIEARKPAAMTSSEVRVCEHFTMPHPSVLLSDQGFTAILVCALEPASTLKLELPTHTPAVPEPQ